MKTVVVTVALLLGAAGMAVAQDDRDRKADELKRDFERAMRGLQQKFESERDRLEKEFKAARDRMLEKKGDRKEGERREEPKPRTTEELLQRVLDRLDHLEKRLDREMPRFDFKDMPFKSLPRDFKDLPKFDFKQFEEFRELAPRWREFMPEFKDKEFRFEFKRNSDDKKEDDEQPKKKEKKDGDKKQF
jgi:hypothetical protein